MSVERSPRRRTLFSWLSVLVLVTSVLWWAPAAAQDATPDEPPVATEAPAPTATEPPAPTATNPPAPEPTPSATTAPEQSIQNLTTLDEATITVTDITITCPVAASAVEGTITIDPAVDGTITLQLMAGTTELERKDQVISAGTVDGAPFTLPLEANDFASGSEVVVRVFQGPTEPTAELLDADVLKTSDPWPIAQSGSTTVCTPPSTPASPTVAPSPTPSPTVDPSATVTPSPSPTATTPPNVTTGTVVNTGGAGLRCRTAPVSGTVIMVITEGSKVQVRGATENGWVPVRCNNRDGWASATYLTLTTGPAPTATPVPSATPTTTPGGATVATVVNTGGDNLRCRTAPVSGATIVSLPMGTRVEVRGATENGWVPVKCSGQNGWMSAAYLSLETGSTNPTPTPTTTPGGNPGTGNGKYVTVSGTGGAGLRCRTAAVSGNVITLLQDGARVETRGSAVNNWVPVVCAGQAGWVSAAYVLYDVAAGSGELWFDVNLSTQYMRVFRGNTVIMQTYVSTGRPGFDTPTGTFYINRKLPTRTMTGVLGGEYYYVPNVPWVMYFTNVGHAIHGTYWHNNFGRVMSHGCINLPVSTAQYLYSITPIGTRMRIHY